MQLYSTLLLKGKESKEIWGISVDTARLSSKGQVTIPIGIRRKLGLKTGENVLFIEHSSNVIIASEQEIKTSISGGWSKEFIAAFSRFNDTADDTFVAPEDMPIDHNSERAEFE